jgi:lactocepin
MLSAAAGNNLKNPELPSGTAPEAQILAMKVYSDILGTANEAVLISAMEDAVNLGADVICLSLGEPCGFSDSSASGVSIESAIREAEARGIIVVASAGNSGKLGQKSIYYDEYAISAPTTDKPDTGSIAYPGSSASAFTAACAKSNISIADYLTLSDGINIPYGDSNYMYLLPSGGKSFRNLFDGKALNYEIIDGIGKPEEFGSAPDLSGKLAVIERGDLTFVAKAQNAAEHGAIGVIIIDNQPDAMAALSVKMELSTAPIPVIIISKESGSLLKSTDTKI